MKAYICAAALAATTVLGPISADAQTVTHYGPGGSTTAHYGPGGATIIHRGYGGGRFGYCCHGGGGGVAAGVAGLAVGAAVALPQRRAQSSSRQPTIRPSWCMHSRRSSTGSSQNLFKNVR